MSELKKQKKAHNKGKKSGPKEGTIENTKPEFYFKLIDGSETKNLQELAEAFHYMSDDVFYYHVNDQKNDFSNWVRDVFKQEKLADIVLKSNSRLEAETNILRFLVKELTR